MGKLIAINISEKRGTEKKEIQEAKLVTDFGIAGTDAGHCNGIQIYVNRQENRVEALAIRGTAREEKVGTQPFSKEQKVVLKRLIANYTGDAKGADQFVENFRLDGDSHGTIGNKKWRLGTGKDYNEMPAYKINFS